MPTLKAPRKTVSVPAKKAVAKKTAAPKIDPDKIAKAKAAAAAKKNGAAPKPTAATKTAAAVKKAAVAKRAPKPALSNNGTTKKAPAPAKSKIAKRTYKPGDTLPVEDVIYKRSEIKDWSRDKKEIAAALIHAPKSLYAKMTDAELDELLYGNHPYWDGVDA